MLSIWGFGELVVWGCVSLKAKCAESVGELGGMLLHVLGTWDKGLAIALCASPESVCHQAESDVRGCPCTGSWCCRKVLLHYSSHISFLAIFGPLAK